MEINFMKKISTTCMISASIRVTKFNDIVAVNENNVLRSLLHILNRSIIYKIN